MKGALPRVGEPGHTLGGRVLPDYGFTPTEGGDPIQSAGPPQPTASSSASEANPFLGLAAAIAEAESLYRARCIGCHKAGGGSGPNLFRTRLSTKQFTDEVQTGGNGMPSFRELLSQDEILKIHALVLTRDQL
jgi:cytochrome c551